MILRVEDFADEIYKEFQDKIPGLTKRKVELLLKNSFFCVSYHISRINPMQLGEMTIKPSAYYAALITNNRWIVPYKGYTRKKRLNDKIRKLDEKIKKYAT